MADTIDVRPNPIVLFPGAATRVSLRCLHADDYAWTGTTTLKRGGFSLSWAAAGTPYDPADAGTWSSATPSPLAVTYSADGELSLSLPSSASLDASKRYLLKVGLLPAPATNPPELEVPVLLFAGAPSELRVRNRQVTIENDPSEARTLSVVARFAADDLPPDTDLESLDEALSLIEEGSSGRWWNVSMSTWLTWTASPAGIVTLDAFGTLTAAGLGLATVACSRSGVSFPKGKGTTKAQVVARVTSIALRRLRGDPRADRHMLVLAEGFHSSERLRFDRLVDLVSRQLRERTANADLQPARWCVWHAWTPSPQRGTQLRGDTFEHVPEYSEIPDTAWGIASEDPDETTLTPSHFHEPLERMGVEGISPTRWHRFLARLAPAPGDPFVGLWGGPDLARWKLGLARPNDPVVIVSNDRHGAGTQVSPRASGTFGFVHVTASATADTQRTLDPVVDGNEHVIRPLQDGDLPPNVELPQAAILTAATLAHELGHYFGLGDEYGSAGTLNVNVSVDPQFNLFSLPAKAQGNRTLAGHVDELPWDQLARASWAGRVHRVTPGDPLRCAVFLDLESAGALLSGAKADRAAASQPNVLHWSNSEWGFAVTKVRLVDYELLGAADSRMLFVLQLDAIGIDVGDVLIGPRRTRGTILPEAWSLIAPLTRSALASGAFYEGVLATRATTPPARFGGPPPRAPKVKGDPSDLVAAYEGGASRAFGVVHASGRCKMNQETRVVPGPAGINVTVPAPLCFVCRYILALKLDPSRLRPLDRDYVEVR